MKLLHELTDGIGTYYIVASDALWHKSEFYESKTRDD